METKLEKEVRFLKIYAAFATLSRAVFLLTAFTQKSGEQKFDEITKSSIKFVDSEGKERARLGADSSKGDAAGLIFYDSAGKGRLRLGADIGKGGAAGLVFYNEEGTEARLFSFNRLFLNAAIFDFGATTYKLWLNRKFAGL